MSSTIDKPEMSFWQLISISSKIEIPIIQRDYAQGRDDDKTKKIRDRFLESLINAIIQNNNQPQELDFIYGSIIKNVFQPLDGQQRLTTLFLLHWFIAKSEDKLKDVEGMLLKFTYETRTSSSEFCVALVEDGNNLGSGETISKKIKDASWFFISWEKDPTIKAMLIMLDAIEIKINRIEESNKNNLWAKLISAINPPIIFHFKELKYFGISDDLYIKMNARGKALTDFEHFKANFEKWISDNKWEMDNDPTQTFSHKIDTVWTDLFWKYRNAENQIDNSIIKFIGGVAINLYAQNQAIYQSEEQDKLIKKELEEKSKDKTVSREAIKRERLERRIAELFNDPKEVNSNDFFQQDDFKHLFSCFDNYADKAKKYDELLPENLPLWNYCKDCTLFNEFIKNGETTYKQRVLFYAQTAYFLNNKKFDAFYFTDWMRVVRNIVENSIIDSANTFIGAMGLINELSKGTCDIYEFLAENKFESKFASLQTGEEILKSMLIRDVYENKQVIFETEDTSFCKGRIKFALYCVDYEKPVDNFDFLKLSKIQHVINEHLSEIDITNLFRSAFLTIGNNDFYHYWGGTWSNGPDSQKRCLIENTSNLKPSFTDGYYKRYLKELLNHLVSKNLTEIIQDYSYPDNMPNWKKRLIREPALLDEHCQSHFFGVTNDNNHCYLFGHRNRPSNKGECFDVQ